MASKHLPVAAPRAEDLNPRTSTIGDNDVRIVAMDGEEWVSVADLGPALKYSDSNKVTNLWRMRFKTNGYTFDDYLKPITAANRARSWFVNEEGLRIACLVVPPRRSAPLREWLERGGMNPGRARNTISLADPHTPSIAPASSPKAYCGHLAEVITRYLTVEERAEFAGHLESFARSITARRYCPGLNDATYDLYAQSHQLRKEG